MHEHIGLSYSQVIASRAEHGENSLTKRKRKSWLRSFFGNFADPMLRILLIALGINCVFIFNQRNFLETFGIAAAILIAAVVSTIAEYGSESAFEKLQQTAQNISVRVRRDGKTVQIPITEVVVGDIILLSSGDKIPADGVIISGAIEVDQSLLNGESKDARKCANGASPVPGDFLDENLLFSGTVVTNGEAVMCVKAVGDKTVYGKLAAELQAEQPKSPLKIKLEKLAKMISLIGYIGASLVAVAYLFSVLVINKQPLTFTYILAVATLVVSVIVMAVPEGLPLMVSVVLSSNIKHMLRDKVLIRKLNGIETAGSINILFTDKTGTLTNGKLEVVEVIADDMQALGTVLYYNNGAEMSGARAIGGNFTDRILLEYAQKLSHITGVSKTDVIPFNSTDKYMATTLSNGQVLYKGAAEVIMSRCTKFFRDRNTIEKKIDELTARAYRIIAAAIDDTLIGIVAIRDQIRPEAVTAVNRLQGAGIQTVMITGDAKATALAVAREVGIFGGASSDLVLTSAELGGLSDEQLAEILPNLRVVARALPSDKSRLIRVAQSLNLVTGMTGDGVNDAPALKLADIGFAMGSGTEVAKEAGDIVILDDNINSITKACAYGRTIFKSIRKFLIFKLTINFCAMAVSIAAPFLNVATPITVLQMLWINIVMDTLAGLAYGGERPRKQYMAEPPKRRDEPIINKYMWQQIIVSSVYMALISLWFLKSPTIQGALAGRTAAYAMTAFFAFFMFINIFNSFNSRTHDLNLISYLSLNKPFVWIMGVITVAQVLLIYFGGSIFRTEGLELKHFALVTVLALTIIPIDMLRKLIVGRRAAGT